MADDGPRRSSDAHAGQAFDQAAGGPGPASFGGGHRHGGQGIRESQTPQASSRERFYCPFPGCHRSFLELWRLRVHYRANSEARGSGKERGHGTELPFCPKCRAPIYPGKKHMQCRVLADDGGFQAPLPIFGGGGSANPRTYAEEHALERGMLTSVSEHQYAEREDCHRNSMALQNSSSGAEKQELVVDYRQLSQQSASAGLSSQPAVTPRRAFSEGTGRGFWSRPPTVARRQHASSPEMSQPLAAGSLRRPVEGEIPSWLLSGRSRSRPSSDQTEAPEEPAVPPRFSNNSARDISARASRPAVAGAANYDGAYLRLVESVERARAAIGNSRAASTVEALQQFDATAGIDQHEPSQRGAPPGRPPQVDQSLAVSPSHYYTSGGHFEYRPHGPRRASWPHQPYWYNLMHRSSNESDENRFNYSHWTTHAPSPIMAQQPPSVGLDVPHCYQYGQVQHAGDRGSYTAFARDNQYQTAHDNSPFWSVANAAGATHGSGGEDDPTRFALAEGSGRSSTGSRQQLQQSGFHPYARHQPQPHFNAGMAFHRAHSYPGLAPEHAVYPSQAPDTQGNYYPGNAGHGDAFY